MDKRMTTRDVVAEIRDGKETTYEVGAGNRVVKQSGAEGASFAYDANGALVGINVSTPYRGSTHAVAIDAILDPVREHGDAVVVREEQRSAVSERGPAAVEADGQHQAHPGATAGLSRRQPFPCPPPGRPRQNRHLCSEASLQFQVARHQGR